MQVPESLVRVRDVSLEQGGRDLLSRVTIDVLRGEAVAVVGDNGSGKTTFLRILLGDLAPTKGEVMVFDERASPSAMARHSVGAVVGNPVMLDWMRVGQFLRMLIESSGRRSTTDGVRHALSLVGAEAFYSHRISQLSQGERQLVAIAIALIDDPELLILDEPSAHLDASRRALIWRLFSDRITNGRTTIFTSHHPDDLDAATRVISMSDLASGLD